MVLFKINLSLRRRYRRRKRPASSCDIQPAYPATMPIASVPCANGIMSVRATFRYVHDARTAPNNTSFLLAGSARSWQSTCGCPSMPESHLRKIDNGILAGGNNAAPKRVSTRSTPLYPAASEHDLSNTIDMLNGISINSLLNIPDRVNRNSKPSNEKSSSRRPGLRQPTDGTIQSLAFRHSRNGGCTRYGDEIAEAPFDTIRLTNSNTPSLNRYRQATEGIWTVADVKRLRVHADQPASRAQRGRPLAVPRTRKPDDGPQWHRSGSG